VIFFLLINYG